MKINEVKLTETLPPHLAKFFDKDGNYNKAAQARIDAGRKNSDKGKWKDATPKGYGPDEVDEAEVPERISIMSAVREEHKKTQEGYSSGGKYFSAGDPNFLIRESVDGRPGTRWSIMNYKDTPGSNPVGLRTKLNQHAKSIGFDGYTVIGQWVGDLDKVLEYAKSQLNSNENWIDSVKHDLDHKIKTLTNAKKVMGAGEEVTGEKLDEYKPGVTVLTRSIAFNDFEQFKGTEDYATVKNIRWPYGIDVRFNDNNQEVTFKTAKMKTVAKILNKHIDFDSISAGEVLDLPTELMGEDVKPHEEGYCGYCKGTGTRDVGAQGPQKCGYCSGTGKGRTAYRPGNVDEDAQDVANDKIGRIEAGIDVYMKNEELLGRSMPEGFARELAIVIAAELEANGGEIDEGTGHKSGFAQRPIHVLMQEIELVLPDIKPYGAKEHLLGKIDSIMHQPGEMEEDKRDIKSVKKTKTGTKYQMKSGTMVYDMKEGMPPANQTVVIAHKGKKIGSFEVRYGAKVHHIDQELRKLSKDITLGNFERTNVARDLAHGKIARSGDFAFQIQDTRPKELE